MRGWATVLTAGPSPTGTAMQRSVSWPCCSAPWTWVKALCILGTFRGEGELATHLGVPPGWRLFCAVVVGHPDGRDHRSASLDRPRPRAADRVHRARWSARLEAP